MPPTQKRSKSSALRRASHFALEKRNIHPCPKCGQMKLAHRACDICGGYKK